MCLVLLTDNNYFTAHVDIEQANMTLTLLYPQLMRQPTVSVAPAPLSAFPQWVKRSMGFLLSSTESGIRHPSQRLSAVAMGMATDTGITWSAHPELQIAEVRAMRVENITTDEFGWEATVITYNRFHILCPKETPHMAGLLRLRSDRLFQECFQFFNRFAFQLLLFLTLDQL